MINTTIEKIDWAEVASKVVFVPPEFAQPSLDAHHAMDMLRCDKPALNVLISAGLPAAKVDDDLYFDPNDIYNLGTYSGLGTTQPELAFKLLFRYMSAEVTTLTSSRVWSLRLQASCRDCIGTNNAAAWTVAEPATPRFGGSVTQTAFTSTSDTVEYSAVVTNGGVRTPVVSQTIRHRAMELLESGLRWQMLPPAMQGAFEDVHARGVTNCISMSLALAKSLTAAGYEAAARRGWFCGVLGGLLDLPHAWVEVVDDDGHLKAISLATSLLARKVHGSNEFREVCIGTPFNRVIPAHVAADAPLVRHSCGASEGSLEVRTDIRPQKSQGNGGER